MYVIETVKNLQGKSMHMNNVQLLDYLQEKLKRCNEHPGIRCSSHSYQSVTVSYCITHLQCQIHV